MKYKTVEELKELSNELRAYCLIEVHAANSGHPGGCLSSMDILTALYFNKLNHDSKNPYDDSRDRVFISKGHIAPAVYAVLGKAGYYDLEEIMSFRKFKSPFQGHPSMNKLDHMEISSGSLGQGLGVSVGASLAAKLKGQEHKIYCLMGDGEQQEGNIWESAMSAAHYGLDNLVGIVDVNKLQIDGSTKDIMNIEPIADKYRSFGWNVIEIDGNNMEEILRSFDSADSVKGKPTAIIADTIKGKGVSYIENQVKWHSGAPDYEQLKLALNELGYGHLPYDRLIKKSRAYAKKISEEVEKEVPKFSSDYFWNSQPGTVVKMRGINKGVFDCLEKIGDNEEIVVLPADSHKMVTKGFIENHPERENRVINLGIAEQNMAVVAAGLAKEGFIPVIGAYSIFSPGRNWDQIRTSICFCDLNAKIIGVGGLVGLDGGTHEGLEEIAMMESLPNMRFSIPCDAIEAEKAAEEMILNIKGPCFMRIGKVDIPLVTKKETPFQFGTANIIRYRGGGDFVDSFETQLSTSYKNEDEQLSIVSCGVGVSESMRAAYILKKEHGIETRVINMHTIKPLDKQSLMDAARDSDLIITVEEHQKGGLGNLVAGAISGLGRNPPIKMIGVEDRFGESGEPYELIKHFKLNAENIVNVSLKNLKQ